MNKLKVLDNTVLKLIAISIMMMYNGKKGFNLKYFFYTFYPLHLLILIIVRALIK